MADAPAIHPLRQRMIEGMSMRGLAASTQRNCIRVVRACAKFARKPPGDLAFDDARAFQLHLMKDGASISTVNSHAIALRFLLPRHPASDRRSRSHLADDAAAAHSHGADPR